MFLIIGALQSCEPACRLGGTPEPPQPDGSIKYDTRCVLGRDEVHAEQRASGPPSASLINIDMTEYVETCSVYYSMQHIMSTQLLSLANTSDNYNKKVSS